MRSKFGYNAEEYYLSPYALAVQHGFRGTEDEWLASLKGEKGDQGEKGDPGERGVPGEGVTLATISYADETYSCDMSFAEIHAEIENGSTVVAWDGRSTLTVGYYNNTKVIFCGHYNAFPQGPGVDMYYTVLVDDSVTYDESTSESVVVAYSSAAAVQKVSTGIAKNKAVYCRYNDIVAPLTEATTPYRFVGTDGVSVYQIILTGSNVWAVTTSDFIETHIAEYNVTSYASIPNSGHCYCDYYGTLLPLVRSLSTDDGGTKMFADVLPKTNNAGEILGAEIVLAVCDSDAGWSATSEDVGGGGGTSDYDDLSNKPQIGGVTLSGNKSAAALGLVADDDLEDYQTTAITDTGGYFTTDTVEGALQELGAELSGINTLVGSGVIE